MAKSFCFLLLFPFCYLDSILICNYHLCFFLYHFNFTCYEHFFLFVIFSRANGEISFKFIGNNYCKWLIGYLFFKQKQQGFPLLFKGKQCLHNSTTNRYDFTGVFGGLGSRNGIAGLGR